MSSRLRRCAAPAVLFLGMLLVLLFGSGCTPTQIIAFNDRLNRPPVFFNDTLALSPDGKLAATVALVRGVSGTVLAVLNVDSGELRTFVSPDSEHWYGPTFSPAGDRIAFVRGCKRRCKGGNAYQIAILDLKTNTYTTETTEEGFARRAPVFSPDGRFIAYGALRRAYDNRFHRLEYSYWWGLRTRGVGVLDLETGVEKWLPLDDHGGEWIGPVLPAGFLDGKTLIVNATWPKETSPFVRQLSQRTGKPDIYDRYFPYIVSFDRPFTAASPPPRVASLDLPADDLALRSTLLGVSSDVGAMVLKDQYEILFSDSRKNRPVATFFFYRFTWAGVSKSGNRAAFLVLEDRLTRQLWMLDIPTGKVWLTGLKDRLHELYVSPRRSAGAPLAKGAAPD